jgi:Family of unknown function (DUF5989)
MNEMIRNEFEQAASRFRTAGLVREFWGFLNQNKKWWLLPILLVLLLLGAVVLLSSSVVAPFLYPLF